MSTRTVHTQPVRDTEAICVAWGWLAWLARLFYSVLDCSRKMATISTVDNTNLRYILSMSRLRVRAIYTSLSHIASPSRWLRKTTKV